MPSWYEENIEEGVRDVVRILRDNGFNTECSCHHDMQVMLSVHMDGEIQRLHTLLYDNGFRNYSLQWSVNVKEGYIVQEWVSVTLCDREKRAKEQ